MLGSLTLAPLCPAESRNRRARAHVTNGVQIAGRPGSSHFLNSDCIFARVIRVDDLGRRRRPIGALGR
jgi:hypothetical protein